jgi:hypothetical protein
VIIVSASGPASGEEIDRLTTLAEDHPRFATDQALAANSI